MAKKFMDMDFDSNEIQTIYPPITPYLYKKLEKKYVDYLWKIIKYTIQDANIFVISHKTGMDERFEDVIKFEKVKGFSGMVK